mgnify:CR=1 FL=1
MLKDRTTIAASIHPASANETNKNRGKRRTSHPLAPAPRLTVKRGALRSSVTVIRVDPATLRASRARTRNGNVSERVLDAGTVVARNVKSRATLRKLAA